MSFFEESLAGAFLVAAVLCLLFAVALYRRSRELESSEQTVDNLLDALAVRTEERDMAQRDVKHWYAEARKAETVVVTLENGLQPVFGKERAEAEAAILRAYP